MTIGEKIRYLLENNENVKKNLRTLKTMKYLVKTNKKYFWEIESRSFWPFQPKMRHVVQSLRFKLMRRNKDGNTFTVEYVDLCPLSAYLFENENN